MSRLVDEFGGVLAFRAHVIEHGDHADRIAVGIAQRRGRIVHFETAAIRANDGVVVRRIHIARGVAHARTIARMRNPLSRRLVAQIADGVE